MIATFIVSGIKGNSVAGNPLAPENTCYMFTVPLNSKHCVGPCAGLFNRIPWTHGCIWERILLFSPEALVLPSLFSNLFKANPVIFAPCDVPSVGNLATRILWPDH